MTHESLTDGLEAPTTGALLLPLIGSLLVTGAVAALLCQPPAHPLPWPCLLALAAGYLAMAALAHAGAVWLVHRIFDDFLPGPTKALIVALWSTVAWLPLLALLTSQQSLWVAATLPLITNYAVRFLTQTHTEPEPEVHEAIPFLVPQSPPLWRALLPAIAAAAALEGGLLCLIAEHTWLAGLLFAGALSLPVWRLVHLPGPSSEASQRTRRRRLLRESFAAWLLTAIALTPFAASGLLAHALLRTHPSAQPTTAALHTPKKVFADSKKGLEFVILTQPAKAHVTALPRPTVPGGRSAEPLKIPFDGSYWFFKHPGEQPGPAARKERGDPAKVNIRSTDNAPMLMEAHQAFSPPLPLTGARTLALELTNADDRPGAISAEVLLQTVHGDKTILTSLGTHTLTSSQGQSPALGRAPVQETLRFAIPAATGKTPATAITIRLKSDSSRSLAAPMVSLRDLILEP